ncbi:MAG: hypothetical protein IJ215_05750 [Clostridia bacterium]|nr:hypothetical protein [Clostridia bacterium]
MPKKKKRVQKSKMDFIDILLFICPFLGGLLSIWSLALLVVVCLRWNLVSVEKEWKANIT